MHSIMRAKQRAGLNEKRANKMIDLARVRGIRSSDCKWSSDRNFLEYRSDNDTEAVAFNGYCDIFQRQTMNCITLYQLPKNFGKKKTRYIATERRQKRYEEKCYV